MYAMLCFVTCDVHDVARATVQGRHATAWVREQYCTCVEMRRDVKKDEDEDEVDT